MCAHNRIHSTSSRRSRAAPGGSGPRAPAIATLLLAAAFSSTGSAGAQEARAGSGVADITPPGQVTVVVSNPSSWDLTVRALRSVSAVAFEERVPANTVHRFRLPEAAFGDGPVTFEIRRGLGTVGGRHRVEGRLRVSGGSVLWLDVPDDLDRVALRVMETPEMAGTSGQR